MSTGILRRRGWEGASAKYDVLIATVLSEIVCMLMNLEQCTYVDLVIYSREGLDSGNPRDAIDGIL